MNLKPLALLHSFPQRVSRSSWLLFLTFMVVQTGFAQQNLISEAQLVDPSKLIAPSNPDNLVPTSANVAATLSATNGTSDYYYVCSWANIPAQCCDEAILVRASKNSFNSGTIWWEVGASYNGSYTRNIGPNMSELLYVTVFWSGYDDVICTVYNCSTNANAVNSFYGSTSPIYAPSSVTASDGTYDTQVTLSWTHGTDIPHANHS